LYKALTDIQGVSPQQDVSGSVWVKIFNGTSTALDSSNVSNFIRPLLLSNNLNEVDAHLGFTAVGKSLIRTSSQSTARAAIGISSYWSNLLTNTTMSQSQSALGISDYAKNLINKTTATATLDYLGASTLGKQLFTTTSSSNALTTLGVTTTGQSLLASTSRDDALSRLGLVTFGIGLVKTTSAAALRTYSGMSMYTSEMVTKNNAAEVLTYLGFSSYIQGLRTVTDAANFRATIGSHNASNLTTGTLPLARIADSSVTDVKLQSNYVYCGSTKRISLFNASQNAIQLYEDGQLMGVLAYTSNLPSVATTATAGLVREATSVDMNNKSSASLYVKPSVVANGSSFSSMKSTMSEPSISNSPILHHEVLSRVVLPSWMGGGIRQTGRVRIGGNSTITLTSIVPNYITSVSATLDISANRDQRPPHVGMTSSKQTAYIQNPDSDAAYIWYSVEGV